jgi:hypothetical protein
LRATGALGLGCLVDPLAASCARADDGCAADFGPLQAADANGLQLPAGFTSRVVAVTGLPVGDTPYVWHAEPDGGATFGTGDGGWIYVSNSELGGGAGGAGVIAFAPDGAILDAYSILSGTSRNCAGGPTPWGTWLSCEEVAEGRVFECDPFTPGSQGIARPALGTFNHEAAAVDPDAQQVYLTEDRPDGLLYRFTPSDYPSLAAGTLEAAQILDPGGQGAIQPGQVRPLAWHAVPNPNPGAGQPATRYQVPSATPFNGGEGCWVRAGLFTFSTKNDNRVWRVNLANGTIDILYDFATASNPVLSGVDNVYTSPCGDVYVAEDVGNLEIVSLAPSGLAVPIARLTGVAGTEITGPALSPDGTRLYFSSQRNPGVTYEVSGPFAPPPIPSFGGVWALLLLGALGAAALRARRPADR